MMNDLYVLGVTPARAGSKRVPRKNGRLLAGRPLLTYSIEALCASKHVDAVILSTDDEEFAAKGAEYGAKTLALRPSELSNDRARLFEVLAHELNSYEAYIGRKVDIVVSAQASAPLVRPETIDAVVELCANDGVEAVGTTSVIVHGHPYLARRRRRDGSLEEAFALGDDVARYPSQVRPEFEYFDGCVFARRRAMLAPPDPQTNALGNKPHGVRSKEDESINIDTEFDFKLAEFFMSGRAS